MRFIITRLAMFILAGSTALQWLDGEFEGQVKWANNCVFDINSDVVDVVSDFTLKSDRNRIVDDENSIENNQIDYNNNNNRLQLIGQQSSGRSDCGWLCWADVRCVYFSHSDGLCRTLSFKRMSNQKEDRSVRHVPFLADDDTICGYIPSRLTTSSLTTSTRTTTTTNSSETFG